MRVVLQRVNEASVTVAGKVISKIGNGFLILLGIEAEDTLDDINWLTRKIARLRVFSDDNDAMNRSQFAFLFRLFALTLVRSGRY